MLASLRSLRLGAVFVSLLTLAWLWNPYGQQKVAPPLSLASNMILSHDVEDLSYLDRLIVVAHFRESLEWVPDASAPCRVIDKDNLNNLDNMNSNNHTESSSYLYFMIKYYDHLPQKMAFIHGHGSHRLMKDEIRGSLRTSPAYDPESEEVIDPWFMIGFSPINYDDLDLTVNTLHEEEGGQLFWFGYSTGRPPLGGPTSRPDKDEFDHGYYALWSFLQRPIVEGGLGMTLPRFITYKCCSSFVVDRDDIRRIPRNLLQRLFHYLEAESLESAGNAMEHIWHVLFNVARWPT